MTAELALASALFIVAAIVVVGAAISLAIASDIIAARTGWGRLWVGSLLLAGATSLPELATNIAAVRIEAPALAAGNIFGANMLNMSNLALATALFGGAGFFQRVLPQQTLVANFAIAMTGVATLFVVLNPDPLWGTVSLAGLVILIAYVMGSRLLHQYSAETGDVETTPIPQRSLRWGWTVFGLSAATILVSAPLLAVSAERIAEATGLATSFVGVLGLALVTTLPELAVIVMAIRIGAQDLAIAGMYGSNAFNIAVLGIVDLATPGRSLFQGLDEANLAAALFAILLMSLGMAQLLLRQPLRQLRLRRLAPPRPPWQIPLTGRAVWRPLRVLSLTGELMRRPLGRIALPDARSLGIVALYLVGVSVVYGLGAR